MWVFPLGAAAVSGVFSALLWRHWAERRRAHLAWWGVALAMFAVASLAAAVGVLAGWDPLSFRTYYLLGAIVNVPVLAMGTVYLLAPRAVARLGAGAVIVASIVASIHVAGAELDEAGLRVDGIPSGSEVMPASVRALSRYYSFTGFFVVLGGAVWSAWRLARRREPHLRRLAAANTLIAAGTIVVAVASGFARYGGGSVFAVGLFAGVVLMFAGFLKTRPRSVPPGGA